MKYEDSNMDYQILGYYCCKYDSPPPQNNMKFGMGLPKPKQKLLVK